ncbi:MAG: hypothetical protein ACRYFU_17000 [Janthinobacterium lividum]
MNQSATASSSRQLLWPATLCLLPIVAFYAMLWHAARPVPMFDDYHSILFFLLRMRELPGTGAKLLYVFAAQHDEYKLIVEHAVVAADWAVTGRVHFGMLTLLGNVLVLGFGWLLWKNTWTAETTSAQRLLLFAPVCYLLFQLNYVENLDWAMCCLQTMPVLFFTMASLQFLFRQTPAASWRMCVAAGLCAWMASLSSANGFLLAPIGFVVYVWRREWSKALGWTATMVFALALYLYRYERTFAPATETHTGPGDKLRFFLSFVGAAAENMHHFPVRNGSVVLGIILVASLAYACFTSYPQAEPTLFCLAVWCLLSAAIVTERRIIYGTNLSLTERYKIYSDLLLIVCYRFWLSRVRWRQTALPRLRTAYAAVLVGVILFCGVSDVFGYRYLERRQRRVAQGLNAFASDPERTAPEISITGEPFAGPEPEFTREVLNESIKADIFTLPPVSAR